ncbi:MULTISPECIES: efflux RND transporter permease subunit [Pseudomonas]|jgi:predicted RND superfamily exporter protein|uniref:RND family transporter n=2 Tax=Pseudomonas TaxID=286 RepID=A0A7X1GFI0_9PSED|nr:MULTISPECIES: efflux RND transporter permease subunit [Pseudomonas]MBC2691515.1 RND family transporter [Pseudomonas kielensis]NBB33074.1 MMPL family transporter [Pseudomonas sp. BC115LW]UZM15064.1 efflux RND transporter permease subunit [Pseudomonas kielensis]
MLTSLVLGLERFFFRHRLATLGVLALVTLVMAGFAAQLRMSAGFDKQLPQQHEFIKTFNQYRDVLFGANRIIVVLHAKHGDIWNKEALTKLNDLTQTLFFMPGIDRRTVTSLWTPNTRAVQITEEGMKAEDVVGGDVTVATLNDQAIAGIRERTLIGGFVGSLVANDYSGAMVLAELADPDPQTGQRLNYLEFSQRLEDEVRAKYGDDQYEVQIIGFAKQMGDIGAGATSVMGFFALAFLLTVLAVYWYTRSWALTFLPLCCSLVSVVWQFGTITLLGFGLDPLAILVPFLVFAIGVSHGVQQVNFISKEVCAGADGMTAARRSFSGLLIPGTLALITAFVGFATLVLVPIPMIRELAITASVGVAYKIVTNLIMLPVLASYFRFDQAYVTRVDRLRRGRDGAMLKLGRIAETRNAAIGAVLCLVLLVAAVWQSQGRHVGHVLPGAPELHIDSRYNKDVESVVSHFGLGLDLFTVAVETPQNSCYQHEVMAYIDRLTWYLANVPGVLSAQSLPVLTKLTASGVNEGNPKWVALPADELSLGEAVRQVPEGLRLYNADCSLLPINLYLADHKASTLKTVVEAVQQYRAEHPMVGVNVRLASGNAGVQAATNEIVESSELPMMLYVYLTIVLLVFLVYRDWRAMVACCLPLTLATFLGYCFMKALDIGLTVATLPVMVLAVGIGVDYAFYIYNRLQLHLAEGLDIASAFKLALREVGVATIFTAITLSIGVATWSFSALKFQADMGLLLTFMFMVNMLMAITLLPAIAVMLDVLIPRRGPVCAPLVAH